MREQDLNKEIDSSNESILIICAHPDDHIIGAGGTINKYSSEGKNVHSIVLSKGEKSHPWFKSSVTKEMRVQETREADEIVGCTSHFFDFEEGSFMEDYEKNKEELKRIVEEVDPDKIFTHNNEDPHPDHKSSYKVTLRLVEELNIDPDIFLFSIWNPFSLRETYLPQMYVDIQDYHSNKIESIKKFRSQWLPLTYLLVVNTINEVRNGLHIGSRSAEKFYKLV